MTEGGVSCSAGHWLRFRDETGRFRYGYQLGELLHRPDEQREGPGREAGRNALKKSKNIEFQITILSMKNYMVLLTSFVFMFRYNVARLTRPTVVKAIKLLRLPRSRRRERTSRTTRR